MLRSRDLARGEEVEALIALINKLMLENEQLRKSNNREYWRAQQRLSAHDLTLVL
jgi:hypothetical protein